MIEIKHLEKKYLGKAVLHDINCSFDKGQVYGFMGENGAGKSTLFRCLMRIEKFDGEINADAGISIGYLDDTPYFYSFVTGKEYIEFCLKAKQIPIDKDKIEELNTKLQLPLHRYASSYSLGMKKRLVLMALMLEDNDFNVMDEPFNGLDLAGTIILKQWIQQVKDGNKTIILSSHIISSLTDICDDIAYIHAGCIVNHYQHKSADEIEADITEKYLKL